MPIKPEIDFRVGRRFLRRVGRDLAGQHGAIIVDDIVAGFEAVLQLGARLFIVRTTRILVARHFQILAFARDPGLITP